VAAALWGHGGSKFKGWLCARWLGGRLFGGGIAVLFAAYFAVVFLGGLEEFEAAVGGQFAGALAA
jgi:hypothetical protein